MLNSKFIDDMVNKISQLIPPGMKDIKDDLENNVKKVLQSSFDKLELVSRKEFDIQTQVLLKTREKLEILESQVAELEKRISGENNEG